MHRSARSQHDEERPAARANTAPAPAVPLLALQQTAGNAAVTRMISRFEAAEHEHTTRSEKAQREEAFAQRAADVTKKLDEAGYKAGSQLRGTGTAPTQAGGAMPLWFMQLQHKLSMSQSWGETEEEAQQVLDDYLGYWLQEQGGKIPANLAYLFQYAGRSSIHAAGARKGGNLSVSDGIMGGGLKDGKPTSNWCTQATSNGLLEGMKAMGYAPVDMNKFFKTIAFKKLQSGNKMMIYGQDAYSEPLLPGDQVMYLFETGQYGGHTVTAIQDLDTSFTHISGNSGDAIGVNTGESKRIKTPPTPRGGGKFELGKANQHETPEERAAATAYIRTLDFQGGVLVYSIVRYGAFLDELENLPNLAPDQQEKVLAEYSLRRLRPAPPPAAVTEG